MTDMTATIFDIQRNSFVDGPGIRTTVFFKGCNLRCAWCHNPESQSFRKEILFYKEKCTGCGACRGLTAEDTLFRCPNSAKEICGREYTVDAVAQEILKDKLFYEASGGGVTFSGGECMLQIDFLEEILKVCKHHGLHTAVDTAGHVPYAYFERIAAYTDLFLYDLKCFSPELHRQYTGEGNERILENLRRLLGAGVPLLVRIPIIPTVNDRPEELEKIRNFLAGCPRLPQVELLPYHALGRYKYAALGKQAQPFSEPGPEILCQLQQIFQWKTPVT